jgi:hypothetical protein
MGIDKETWIIIAICIISAVLCIREFVWGLARKVDGALTVVRDTPYGDCVVEGEHAWSVPAIHSSSWIRAVKGGYTKLLVRCLICEKQYELVLTRARVSDALPGITLSQPLEENILLVVPPVPPLRRTEWSEAILKDVQLR